MKIGIITQYYRSINYGGNLQAYALCQFLCSCGYNAEQICYLLSENRNNKLLTRIKNITFRKLFNRVVICKTKINNKYFHRKNCKHFNDVILQRRRKFNHFANKLIPHSACSYSDATLPNCVNDYDAFITGSDQVWNFSFFRSGYFLNFVPADKMKLSYAASIAMSQLNEDQKDYFRNALRDYRAVSVRENSAISLIANLSPVSVESVVDPTLLLSKSEWDNVCCADCLVKEPYVFCYFLGENPASRKACIDYANLHNLKIVSIPMANDGYKFLDKDFGDIEYNASPEEFLSLLKYANAVFTDSFHAIIFSNIYEKQYFVFRRNVEDNMSSRIYNITELFGTTDRYCSTTNRESIEYINSLSEIVYEKNIMIDELIQFSKEFLLHNLSNNEK